MEIMKLLLIIPIVSIVTVQVGWLGGATPLPESLLSARCGGFAATTGRQEGFAGAGRPHMHQVKPPGGGLGASGPKEYLCRARFCQLCWQNLARQSEFLGLPPYS